MVNAAVMASARVMTPSNSGRIEPNTRSSSNTTAIDSIVPKVVTSCVARSAAALACWMAPEPTISTGAWIACLAASRARAMAGITRSCVAEANGWPSFSVSTSTNSRPSRAATSTLPSRRALPATPMLVRRKSFMKPSGSSARPNGCMSPVGV